MSTKGVVWGHAPDLDSEHWDGAFETREAVIKEGIACYEDEPFWIDTMTAIDAADFIPTAEDIVELMSERAADNGGPSEDWPDVSNIALSNLNVFLESWARENARAYYRCNGEAERIDPTTQAKELD